MSDLQWNFSDDHDSLGIVIWDADVRVGPCVLGRLSDPPFRELLSALQQAVAVRWRYWCVEDGRRWNAKRANDAAAASRKFAVWAAQAGIGRAEDIDESVLLGWVEATKTRTDGGAMSLRTRRLLVGTPLLLWRVRDRISSTLGFVPPHDDVNAWVEGREETTPIALIPRPVLDHVVGAACRYVEMYSTDILAARRYVENLAQQWELRHGRERPPFRRACREYGSFDNYLARRFGYQSPVARAAMRTVAPWNPDGLFLRDPDTGQPWLDHIRTRHHLQQLENSLRTACYIVIAFTTGARNTEMSQLRLNCARTLSSVDGRPDEHLIDGFVTKHRGRRPDAESWGVPKIAIDAAGLLLQITASWRARSGSDRLLVTQTGKKMCDKTMNVDLQVFAERIGAPYVDGKPFKITTHMLRVALAQWLGAEPYGEIAGAFHLKQLSTAAFRGYLRRDPQFQSLYESFAVQASSDHLAMLLEEPVIGGRKGAEMMAARTPEHQAALEQKIRGLNLAQAGRNAPSRKSIAKLIKAGRPVYKTKFSMCVFRGDTAECLKDVPLARRKAPKTHLCRPGTCANSTVTRLQVPAYLEDFESYAAMRDDPTSSPGQIELARAEMVKLAVIIAPHAPTLRSEESWLLSELCGADAREVQSVALQQRLTAVRSLTTRITQWGIESMARG